MKVAIIGAGLSGLCLARFLRNKGYQVKVFEKSRGVGGRMSTRHTEGADLDHGCQFFRVRTKEFEEFLQPYRQDGSVREWIPTIVHLRGPNQERCLQDTSLNLEQILVPANGMNHLCQLVSEGIDVQFQVRVHRLERRGLYWSVFSEEQCLGEYDWVVATTPPTQALQILPQNFIHRAALESVSMVPTLAMLLVPDFCPDIHFDLAEVTASEFSWLAWNHKKPGRTGPPSLTGLCTAAYSKQVLEQNPEDLKSHLLNEVQRLLGIEFSDRCRHLSVHRWRYAHCSQANDWGCLTDRIHRLMAIGDWCLGGHVEDAFLSARSAQLVFPTA